MKDFKGGGEFYNPSMNNVKSSSPKLLGSGQRRRHRLLRADIWSPWPPDGTRCAQGDRAPSCPDLALEPFFPRRWTRTWPGI